MRTALAVLLLVGMGVFAVTVIPDGPQASEDSATAQTSSTADACDMPITYQIGRIDAAFGIDEAGGRRAMEAAIAMWEEPLEGELFAYAPDGEMETGTATECPPVPPAGPKKGRRLV